MVAASAASAKLRIVDRSRAGTPAPDIAVQSRDGAPVRLADLRGRAVLLNLWATWCAPCVAELPDLDALAAARAGRLLVVPVSVDLGGWKAVDRFWKPKRFQMLQTYLDADGKFMAAVGAAGLPVSVLYDARGREVWRVTGPLRWTTPEVAALLDA